MKIFSFELDNLDPVQVFNTVYDRKFSLFLDSADRHHPNGRKSFIFFDPLKTIEWRVGDGGNPFDLAKSHYFAAGYFGYDLGRTLERMPFKQVPNVADMAIGFYDFVIEFEHKKNKATLKIIAENQIKADEKHNQITSPLRKQGSMDSSLRWNEVKWENNKTAQQYQSDIQKIIDYILEGDIFQANLSQRFSTELLDDFCSWTHYKHLRAVNPAPFAAYMNCGSTKIASSSPERFLTLENGHVETKPIKGTLPRTEPKEKLANSEKDRAENIMIVDLLRNDLSKVCEKDSIEVPKLCEVETFASVHHLVSTVTGKLREGKTAINLLKACFPGGSITGAPKIRAMEIIDELERTPRGPYCGAMGYITPEGNMDTNILIRTLVYDGNSVGFNTGGGITASSDPGAEYQETLDKAQKILESFKCS